MLGDFSFFIVMYVITEGQNEMVHMVGFEHPPTIVETKAVLDEAINDDLVPHETKPVFMAQVDRKTACQILGIVE